MIFDCFLYNNEKSLLKIRLEELAVLGQDIRHILIESKYTFTGIEKPFIFAYADYPQYNVSWIPMAETPNTDPWENETRMRNLIKTALMNHDVEDNDIVIISDVDEIPKADTVALYKKEYGICSLQMDYYNYYLNCLVGRQMWTPPRIMTYGMLKNKTPNQVRAEGFNVALPNGGWHFTYTGGIKAIMDKFQSFSHQEEEIQRWADPEVMKSQIDNLESIWGEPLTIIPIDDTFPLYVQKNQELLKHLIKKV